MLACYEEMSNSVAYFDMSLSYSTCYNGVRKSCVTNVQSEYSDLFLSEFSESWFPFSSFCIFIWFPFSSFCTFIQFRSVGYIMLKLSLLKNSKKKQSWQL